MNTDCDIEVKFLSRRALLASSKVDGSALSLFAPIPREVQIGAPLRLHIELADCKRQFVLNGKVSFSRTTGRGLNQEAGVAVAFEGPEKRAAAEMLAFCAGKPLSLGTASAERRAVRVRCRLTLPKRRIRGFVHDLSSTGAFVNSRFLVRAQVGATVLVELNPSWMPFRTQRLSAVVVWAGEKNGMPGCAIRFVGEVARTRLQLKKYLSA
jgi:Tfp pilus assembly protein PilZ